jgi:ParB-like chromosome segregation protein Spo0J
LDDTGEQVPMARRAVSGAWTVRQTEDEVRAVNQRAKGQQAAAAEPSAKSPAGTARAGVDPDTAAATRELEVALGTRVEIRRQGAAGQVVIHFYSEEELNGIYDHLTRGA